MSVTNLMLSFIPQYFCVVAPYQHSLYLRKKMHIHTTAIYHPLFKKNFENMSLQRLYANFISEHDCLQPSRLFHHDKITHLIKCTRKKKYPQSLLNNVKLEKYNVDSLLIFSTVSSSRICNNMKSHGSSSN